MTIRHYVIAYILLVLFAAVLVGNAWVGDDAYITFRTIDNFVNGYGLTWNTMERVQAYTHPLWMFVMTFIYLLTNEFFLSVIIVSLVLSLAVAWLITFRVARHYQAAVLGLLFLIASQAFIEYTVGGLENPLTHFLIILFALPFLSYHKSSSTYPVLFLIAALAALNRLDTVLLFVPALVVALFEVRSWRSIKIVLLCLSPLIVWELFSLYYYGLPFPNTAYAKLSTGIPRHELISQGLIYFWDSLTHDPITLVTIVLAITTAVVNRKRHYLPLAIGIVLYLAYILWIGGDFMRGRFFAAPFLFAVIILVRHMPQLTRKSMAITAAVILALGLLPSAAPIYPFIHYDHLPDGRPDFDKFINHDTGIADERAHYFYAASLVYYRSDREMPNHHWCEQGREARSEGSVIVTKASIGYFGYYAGPRVHIIDNLALTNPFLSHLPIDTTQPWRIGHYYRVIPTGYTQSLRYGRNLITDQHLAPYYDGVVRLTQNSLTDFGRLSEIWRFNTGAYSTSISGYFPQPSVYFSAERLQQMLIADTTGQMVLEIPKQGAYINLGSKHRKLSVDLSLSADDDYLIIFQSETLEVYDQLITGDTSGKTQTGEVHIDVPLMLSRTGIDAVRILPYNGDGRYALYSLSYSN